VEKGLRRLRRRENAEGDKYGRLLIRTFGLPESQLTWARWMGQYHGRLSDLPVAMRRDQLRLWDRPPLSESPAAIWVHLGLAGLARRAGDEEAMDRRLELARLQKQAPTDARLELLLLEAVVAMDRGQELDWVPQAEELLATRPAEGVSYRARVLDQRAYAAARGWRDHPDRLRAALDLYSEIPDEGDPFPRFRRAHGRAWCLWRMEDEGALEEANRAVQFAGDAGLMRFRCMALGLRWRIAGLASDGSRAMNLARRLQDERLQKALLRDAVSGNVS
jgi:hypothetical protein